MTFREWFDLIRKALRDGGAVTTKPPSPTEAGQPTPSDPPPTKPRAYAVREIRKAAKERKGSGLFIDGAGRVLDAVYDNQSRSDTWIRADGHDLKHIEGETANFFETADRRVWVTVEKGTDGRQYELRGTSLHPLSWQAHYCGCGLDIGGKPHFCDCPKGGKPYIRDVAGKTVTHLPGQGIPYDAIMSPSGVAVVTICDGQANGIAWGSGQFIKCDARALVLRAGRLLAGVSGLVQVVTPTGLSPAYSGRLGASIDSMATDSTGATWVSTSSPDCLWRWDAGGAMVKVAEFADESDGGALFRSRVAVRGDRVVWGRNDKRGGNRWIVYEVVPA